MFIDSYATDTVVDLNDFWIKKEKKERFRKVSKTISSETDTKILCWTKNSFDKNTFVMKLKKRYAACAINSDFIVTSIFKVLSVL